jgi:hypothetical protein
MLNSARLTTNFRQRLWASCASLAVHLENIIVKENKEKSNTEKVYGTNPKLISNMSSVVEMPNVAMHSDNKSRSQLSDRGNTVIFIGKLIIMIRMSKSF